MLQFRGLRSCDAASFGFVRARDHSLACPVCVCVCVCLCVRVTRFRQVRCVSWSSCKLGAALQRGCRLRRAWPCDVASFRCARPSLAPCGSSCANDLVWKPVCCGRYVTASSFLSLRRGPGSKKDACMFRGVRREGDGGWGGGGLPENNSRLLCKHIIHLDLLC